MVCHRTCTAYVMPCVTLWGIKLHVHGTGTVIGSVILPGVPALLHVWSGRNSLCRRLIHGYGYRTTKYFSTAVLLTGGNRHSGPELRLIVLITSAGQLYVPFLRFAGNVTCAVLETVIGGDGFLLHAVHHVLAFFLGKQRGEAVRAWYAQGLQVDVASRMVVKDIFRVLVAVRG